MTDKLLNRKAIVYLSKLVQTVDGGSAVLFKIELYVQDISQYNHMNGRLYKDFYHEEMI